MFLDRERDAKRKKATHATLQGIEFLSGDPIVDFQFSERARKRDRKSARKGQQR